MRAPAPHAPTPKTHLPEARTKNLPAREAHAQEPSEGLFARGRGIITGADGTEHLVLLEIAASESARARGLMFREKLPRGTGMLLLWPSAREVGIWMENTSVPLDLLFIDDDGRIVRTHAGAAPFDRTTIGSGAPVRMVLELPAGSLEEWNIRPGDHFAVLP